MIAPLGMPVRRALNALTVLCGLGLSLLLTACQSVPYDYTELMRSAPRSIVVLPPVNNSIEVEAPYIFLSTITRPLAEKGYYVYPVAVIDTFLKENGLPTPEEMNMIPLDKIRQHIGADAVLYVTIEEWGQKYQVIASTTVVRAKMRLVDTRTGIELWQASAHAEQGSDTRQGLAGALLSAVIEQIAGSLSDRTPGAARMANSMAINNPQTGLLNGPYVPNDQ
jgi:hypothetical protein